jgi:hypothetical protein
MFPVAPDGGPNRLRPMSSFSPHLRIEGQEDAMLAKVTVAALAVILFGTVRPTPARAQEMPNASGTAATGSGSFLGLDIFAGAAQYQLKNPPKGEDGKVENAFGKYGWDLGTTVNIGVRWVGITGTVGHHTIENIPTFHVLAGPRFTTDWAFTHTAAGRAFAHVLAGVVRTAGQTPSTPSENGPEVVVGGGFDLFLFRCQFDYVRLGLDRLPRNNFRLFLGGVVPVCLRGCNENQDLIDLSGRRRDR